MMRSAPLGKQKKQSQQALSPLAGNKIVKTRFRLSLLKNSDFLVIRCMVAPLHMLWRGFFWCRDLLFKSYYLLSRLILRRTPRVALHLSVNGDRITWEQAFISLWEPLFLNNCFSKGKSYIKLNGPQLGSPGVRGSRYEAFARSFIGVSYFLHNRKDGLVRLSNGSVIDIVELYREGIINGTNPKHREYWGKISSSIRLVENCSIAIGLLLTKELLWETLTDAEKERVKRWFELQSNEHFPLNNWQWFKVFHHLFLEEACSVKQSDAILESLHNIFKMYNGGGWYSDGMLPNNNIYDYYSCWAMQYYALMFSYLAGDHYKEWKQRLVDNARFFLKDYKHFFSTNAQPPLYGRSQIYRFASLAPWGPAFKLNAIADDAHEIKSLLIGTMNGFLTKGVTRKDGILSCGYFREFQPMMDGYSSPGSPYWAFKGFSVLLLQANHSFWTNSSIKHTALSTVHDIQSINAFVSNDGVKHVIFFPNITAKPLLNDIRYNKYAYSNLFLLNYDRNFPIDNFLVLRKEDGKLCQLVSREVIFCTGGICKSRWQACGESDIEIHTTLIAKIGGYRISHEFNGGGKACFYIGGFPLATNSTALRVSFSNSEVILLADNKEVGIKLISGTVKPGVYKRKGVNPDGKFSYVPYFQGSLKNNECISMEAWAKMYD